MPKIVDHQQRRVEITAIAAQLIADKGIEAATFREIAKVSGYSKGIIEHYFENKSDLISASLDWANNCYYQRAENAVMGKTGIEAIEARLSSTLPMDSSIRMEWKIRLVFWSMACIDPELNAEQCKRVEKTTAHFMADLKSAVKRGDIAKGNKLDHIAQRLIFTISGLSCAAVHNPNEYDKRRLNKEIRHIINEIKQS